MAKYLVLNAGSSSLKWSVLDEKQATLSSGQTRRETLGQLVSGLLPLDAAGHRIVHGGERFRQAVLVDAAVRGAIEELSDLAPLHNPAGLAGIDAVAAAAPGVPQVVAFDTAFHATLSPAAATYALPSEWTRRFGLRRYGFHGLSVEWSARRAAERGHARVVVCHLGAGCSVTAVDDGKSVDTTMGFTPLDGVMMATRCGSVDPGILLYLQERGVPLAYDLEHRSGLLGVSGISSDFKEILARAAADHPGAVLARDMFIHSVVRAAGAMNAVLGGAQALVFTGGIGENSEEVRSKVAALLHLPILVVPAREDLMVLAEIIRIVGPG